MGLRAESVTMLLGSSGSGKTLLSVQFLCAGLQRDERVVYFGFFEPPDVILAKCDRINSGLAPKTWTSHLPDGRLVQINHQAMPDGGWVATHEDITQLRRIEAQMQYMARHDALTDLPNRAELQDFIQKMLERESVKISVPPAA